MKKNMFIVLLFIGFIAACKYEDGPAISFRTFSKRVTGYYNIEAFDINGNDRLSAYMDSCGCDLIIEWEFKNGKYKKYCVLTACKDLIDTWGDFLVSSNKKKVEMVFDSTLHLGYGPLGSKQYSEWTVTRITNKQLWLRTIFDNSEYFIKLAKRE